jgi:hypothetical protein
MKEKNSSKGLTKVQNARVSNRESHELKSFKISLAQHHAMATILLICGVKDKLASHEAPRSVQFSIIGR